MFDASFDLDAALYKKNWREKISVLSKTRRTSLNFECDSVYMTKVYKKCQTSKRTCIRYHVTSRERSAFLSFSTVVLIETDVLEKAEQEF